MNIAIEISAIESAHKYRGTGVYSDYLIKALKKFYSYNSYYLFTRGQILPDNIDLVHYPYFDLFFLTLPLIKPKPTVVTIHDLIPIRFKDKFNVGIRGQIKWYIQRLSMMGCKRIITDSESSKTDVNLFTGYPLNRIDVAHLAPTVITSKKPSNYKYILNKYKIQKPYILYIGDINWNKNLEGIISAYKIINDNSNFINLNLILGGKAFLDNSLLENQSIRRLIYGNDLNQKVIRTGFIKNEDFEVIYREAECFVFPSFYEGFGLPPLDAMHYGCPTVISNSSSLKEIAGPSIQVDPYKSDNIADGIIKILKMNKSERQKYSQSLQKWSANFSWQKTAKATIKSYEKTLQSA